MRRALFAALLALTSGCGSPLDRRDASDKGGDAPPPAFAPGATRAVLAGILEWRDPSIGTFPQAARQDRALETALLERGVPRDQLVFLQDAEATRGRILDEVAAAARATPPGGTLLFYFAGHGSTGVSDVTMLSYDYDGAGGDDTGVTTRALEEAITSGMRSGQVLLFGDFCYSGALNELAERLSESPSLAAGALTSAHRQASSTDQWTFTDVLTAAFTGDARADRDDDGRVTWLEASSRIASEMRWREQQRAAYAVGAGFSPDFALSVRPASRRRAATGGVFRAGDYVEARYDGQWRLAQVDDAEATRARVVFLEGSPCAAWLDAAELRAPDRALVPVGTKVKASFGETQYAGTVLEHDGEWHLVRYDDYGPEYDEWFPRDRLIL